MNDKLLDHNFEDYKWGNVKGADLEFVCTKCGRYLTVIKLNQFCTIDITVECKNCGRRMIGKNMGADVALPPKAETK